MDYLLRDSHHIGVAYGRFDHYRLIDSLRILYDPETDLPKLGIEEGGLHSAEALLLARYFMYTQVYFHSIRRIYDIHLQDFLVDLLEGELFPTKAKEHLKLTDNEVTSALLSASLNDSGSGHLHADRIVNRKHFKLLYDRNPTDFKINPKAGGAVYKALSDKFGADKFRHDYYQQRDGGPDFPVQLRTGLIESSLDKSEVLNSIPVVSVDFVFCEREVYEKAKNWLDNNHGKIIKQDKEEK